MGALAEESRAYEPYKETERPCIEEVRYLSVKSHSVVRIVVDSSFYEKILTLSVLLLFDSRGHSVVS